jgi:hypothetical protein
MQNSLHRPAYVVGKSSRFFIVFTHSEAYAARLSEGAGECLVVAYIEGIIKEQACIDAVVVF